VPNREITPGVDNYSAKLAKLIPAEVSAAYLSINSIVPDPDIMDWHMWGSMLVLTVLCPIYLWRLQNVRSGVQIAITTAAFPVWALNISASRLTIDHVSLAILLILVTLAIPFLPGAEQNTSARAEENK